MTDAYEAAGVSFTSGRAVIDRIASAVKSTHDERVVSGLGGFGGVFDLASLAHLTDPLLVASTDGVGTKTKLSAAMDRWEGAGADIVNHGINDVLVQGAAPLFFFDTIAAQSLEPEIVGRIVDGMAEACRAAECILLGGETAEMPGVFVEGAVDIAGHDRGSGRSAQTASAARGGTWPDSCRHGEQRTPHQRIQPRPAGRRWSGVVDASARRFG